ncbi:MAG: Hsp20 family protein [Acholeplasmatales bacterium]|jgi:HSP20 family protein
MFKLARRGYFDDFFDNFFETNTTRNSSLLSTDIKDTEDHYELIVDVPGFEKDEIKVALEKGYLTISASKDKEENVETGHYVRRERVHSSAVRKFYVGDNLDESDIKAKLDKGVLVVEVPKKEKTIETEKLIEIK